MYVVIETHTIWRHLYVIACQPKTTSPHANIAFYNCMATVCVCARVYIGVLANTGMCMCEH